MTIPKQYLPDNLCCTFECEMEDIDGKFAEWYDGLVTQRKHSQDILDKLEEARNNKHFFLEQTGVDMKALVENGFDANNGRVHPNDSAIVEAVKGLEYQIIPPLQKGEWA